MLTVYAAALPMIMLALKGVTRQAEMKQRSTGRIRASLYTAGVGSLVTRLIDHLDIKGLSHQCVD